ncbi:MAG: HAMP domain-containing histidine kinase [Colwellia sp.]|nr:HAMP domain-containing histidine kinase [Colwellia sp.]
MESILKKIINGVSNTYGEEFFSVITKQLDDAIQSDFTFIARLNKEKHSCQTIALIAHSKLVDNFEYDLEGTPCNDVTDNCIIFYPKNITELYPKDDLLVDMAIEGYIGAPLNDSKGEVLGIIVALYQSPILDKDVTLTLFQLFSNRIAGEFERIDKEIELKELNNTLDNKIQQRTAELESTVQQLKHAHSQLLTVEKMAVLGDLVAGVAHEVNTPLGVAITAESLLSEEFASFEAKLLAEKLSKKDMKHFVEQNQQCLPMISRNLHRAKEIIDNFKRMATEQSEFKQELIYLNTYYQRLISTLNPLLKRRQAKIIFTGCSDDSVMTFPGCHAQLLTNLVNNSIQHGFLENGNNIITICLVNKGREFMVDYFDNGIGIAIDNQENIFQPFYTTKRNVGKTGLGLSICYNLVLTTLKGRFECLPCEQGVHFRYIFQPC